MGEDGGGVNGARWHVDDRGQFIARVAREGDFL
jgi:hypothetical protein